MEENKDYTDALKFAKAANGMAINKKVDNETLYHIVCLSVEKFAATLAGTINYMPSHSGLGFIFRELVKKINLPEAYLQEVRFLNGFMTYCSLDFEQPKVVTNGDVHRMITFLNELKAYTENVLIE